MNRMAWCLVCLGLLGACAPRITQPQPPQVELLQFSLVSVDPFSGRAEFDLQLRLTNPNPFTLPLLESALTAELGGLQLRLALPALEILPGAGREVQTRLVVPVVEGARVLANLLGGQSARLRLLGELRVQLGPAVVPIGPLTLVERDVRVQFTFQPPTLRLAEVRLEGPAIRLLLEAENPNPVGFTLEGPLRILVGGRSVAEGGLSLGLGPGGRNRGEVRLSLLGLPGTGGVSVELGLSARIPGVLDRSVVQVLQGFLR